MIVGTLFSGGELFGTGAQAAGATLACKVLGNGVPCLLSQRIVESIL